MNTKVGLFGIGLETYWAQFDGLLDPLKIYQGEIRDRIASFGVDVVDAGMVDDLVKAGEAAEYLKKQDVDIVFLYVATYALSSTVPVSYTHLEKRFLYNYRNLFYIYLCKLSFDVLWILGYV